ncbi:MAG TPA: fluoride efflux transporter CrcB [Leucothrix sp.]|nr:fluoride efflux transporter CrcB [Leucothrix sp.]
MLGGGLGAIARYMLSTSINEKLASNFPYGTLIVNVIGSFLMGFLAMWLVEKLGLNPLLRLAIFVGFLGAFTTFSTFSMETLHLFEEGLAGRALLNMLVNVVLSVLAVWLGVLAGKLLA